ncbi:hypothetical protein [Myxococcus sp. Y35]|uniref:hypothetical protein n=1 Tax=Pseudomyxococcus flavus TaxID=3115648 RepID=UPI003CE7DEBA
MSYDLLVFDAKATPRERAAFLQWYEDLTEWRDDAGYDDPSRCSLELQAWFREMIVKYPPMNGSLAPKHDEWPEDDARVSDYSLAPSAIYIAFSWSIAEEAFHDTKLLAAKHGVGFFNVNSDSSDVWAPDGRGNLVLLHSES